MSSVRIIDPSTEPRWDEFVMAHPFGWLCHLSGWKKVIEETFGHMKASYLGLYDKDGGELRAALPMFEVKSFITGHRLTSIPFATLSDPLISTRGDMEQLLDSALDLLNRIDGSYMVVRTHLATRLMPDDRLAGTNTYKNHYLRLNAPLDQLRLSFHRTCVRQRIARAVKSGLQLRFGENESDLRMFYELHAATRKRLGLPAPPLSLLEGLWKTFFPAGQLSLLLSEYRKKVVGGIIVLKFRHRMSGEFLGWDETCRDMSPTHHLFWEAIKLADAEGRGIFDFGRSSPVDASLMAFKNRWGTDVVDLPQYYYPPARAKRNPAPGGSLTYRIVREMCKRLPGPGFRLMSGFCFRHMG